MSIVRHRQWWERLTVVRLYLAMWRAVVTFRVLTFDYDRDAFTAFMAAFDWDVNWRFGIRVSHADTRWVLDFWWARRSWLYDCSRWMWYAGVTW